MSTTSAVNKGTQAVKKTVSGKEPGTDLLSTLKEEHEEVADLLKKLVKAEKAGERKSLLAQVKAALIPHARAEEKGYEIDSIAIPAHIPTAVSA